MHTHCMILQIVDDHGVAIADADHPVAQAAVEGELVGPDSKPTDDMGRAVSLAVPLERQISFKFPTVITPSEQAEDLRHIGEDGTEQVLTAKQAAKAYAGLQAMCIEVGPAKAKSVCWHKAKHSSWACESLLATERGVWGTGCRAAGTTAVEVHSQSNIMTMCHVWTTPAPFNVNVAPDLATSVASQACS